jgi:NADP-reducing hydrogenase subunit HndB
VLNAAIEELERSGRQDIIITTSGCAGLCSHEPMVTVEAQGEEPIKYVYVDDPKMRQIFNRHALEGEVQTQFALARGSEQQ